METFSDYILEEEDFASKMEIVYYLSKNKKIFFDKSVIFKTEILRMFLKYSKIDVDNNLLVTASLLCNCKKIDNAQDIETIQSYAKKGAEYLEGLGFGKRFCKICEEINRYSKSVPRERESDILELVDQFGAMLLDKPERIGFKPDEALVLIEYRNLKNEYNQYLETFKDFVNMMEQIEMNEIVNMKVLGRLVKVHNESKDVKDFIKNVIYKYEPKLEQVMDKYQKDITKNIFNNLKDPNRPLFSQETAKKIMERMDKETIEEAKG